MRRFSRRRRQLERLEVIRANRQDLEPGHLATERFGRLGQALLGDIDWHIRDEILEMIE